MIDDAVEFRPWIEAAMNYSYRVACGHVFRSDGQDVAQETMIKLSVPSVNFTVQPPGDSSHLYWFFLSNEKETKHKWAARRATVCVVARHTAMNWGRGAGRREAREQNHINESSSPFEAVFDREDLKTCVEKLPEPFRTCCMRDYFGPGLYRTVEKAAHADGCTENAIKRRRHRYKELLRDCLKRRGLGDGGAE